MFLISYLQSQMAGHAALLTIDSNDLCYWNVLEKCVDDWNHFYVTLMP